MAVDLDLRSHKFGCDARVTRFVGPLPVQVIHEDACTCRAQDWRAECMIVWSEEIGSPRITVRHGEWWLRHSLGPSQCHGWDVYGDNYQTNALALLAIATAPPPPDVLADEVRDGR